MSLPVEFLLIDALRHLDMFSVPGIGSFSRIYIPAKIQADKQVIAPPREIPVFSEEITPGGIRALEQFLARPGNPAEGKEFAADTLGREINRVLNANGKFELRGLGTLLLGTAGLEARWVDDVHLRIYSNLFGFREVKLPAKVQTPVKPAPAPVPVPEVKAPAPVAAVTPVVPISPAPAPQPEKVQPVVEVVSAPAPVPAPLPVPKPEPVVVNPPAPVVVEPAPAPVAEKVNPVTEVIPPVKPREEAEKPAQKAALRHEERKTTRRKGFPWVFTLLVFGLVLIAALWFLVPRDAAPEPKAETVVPVAPPADQPEPEPTPEAAPAPAPGYYLIVTSSRLEADVLREANYWKEQGVATEIIPPDGETEFYRLSVLHSTDRKEVVARMIELKDETYSWILER